MPRSGSNDVAQRLCSSHKARNAESAQLSSAHHEGDEGRTVLYDKACDNGRDLGQILGQLGQTIIVAL